MEKLVNLLDTPWDVASSLMIFLVGAIFIDVTRKKLHVSRKISFILYCWHTIFSIIYSYLALTKGADAIYYYEMAKLGECSIGLGTRAVIALTCILTSMKISFLGAFLVFNILGSIGMIVFFACLKSVTYSSPRYLNFLVVAIIFLPSLSYWSSAIGKDAISFLAINLALWSALNLGKRKLLMGLSIILLLLVRPHIAGMIVISLALSMLIGAKNLSFTKKMFVSSIIFPVVIILVPFAGKYAGIEDVTNVTEVSSYIEDRQSKNMGGGSSLDITNMSLPVKVFTYLFRPLPYEAHSMMSLLSSIENTILLAFFLYTIRFVRVKQNTVSNHAFLWAYIFIATFFLSSMTANLGIAARQKWMIMPLLIYLLFAGISAYQLRKRRIR